MKKYILLIFVIFLASCSQEGLIFIRNFKRVNFNLINQLLLDTGIITNSANTNERIQPDNLEKSELPKIKKIPTENKITHIPSGTTFTIKIPAETNFVALKSIEGDVVFNSNESKVEAGIYNFSAGTRDGKIRFDILDLDGNLIKRVAYYVSVIQKTTNITVEKKPEEKIAVTNVETNVVEKKAQMGINGVIQNIKNNLPYPEAVKEYEKMIASDELTAEEKDVVRNELVELLLKRKNFDKAEKVIKEIENEGRRIFYSGWLNKLKKKENEAYILYRDALEKGDVETKKITLTMMLELLKENKLATLEEVEEIEKRINSYKQDKDYYGRSMIDIAEIYVYFKKVYQSEKILKSIIEGDYSGELKERAKGVYKELKEGFIDYK
ncbi:MAG: tetratricopeptide repeat protein [Brevinematia bacterium]